MHLLRLPTRSPDDAGGDAAAKAAADAAAKAAESAKVDRAEYDKAVSELAALRAAEAERAAKAKADDEAAALKRGEHEKLYGAEKERADKLAAELDGFRKAEEKRLAKIEERNKARVKEIPEDRRSLVPAALKGEDLADYLETNWALLKGDEPRAQGGQRGTPARTDMKGIPAEIAAEAPRYGKDPADWWAIVQRSDPRRAAQLKQQGVN
jgi:hypothetical protein